MGQLPGENHLACLDVAQLWDEQTRVQAMENVPGEEGGKVPVSSMEP